MQALDLIGILMPLFTSTLAGQPTAQPADATKPKPASTTQPATATQPAATTQPAETTGVARLRAEALRGWQLVESDVAKQFLGATGRLPRIAPRTLYRDAAGAYVSKADMERLGKEERKALAPVEIDEGLYYTTKYGSPLAYVRPLDLLGRAGLREVAGKRVLDFGYGTIGHLRLLASLGADVVGVDVDPFLHELYSEPGDQGVVGNRQGRVGRITLVHGQWPAEEPVRKAVGVGFDFILSKNTLKNGYFHPEQPVDERRLVRLGVTDDQFVRALYESLSPGGLVMIYNISPGPSPPGEPYKPWADGRCPFPVSMWESAGFRVLAFDRDDSAEIRKLAHALGWDSGPVAMDLEKDLFGHYSLFERPHSLSP